MLPQDVVPGSPFVMLDMKPGGEIEFLFPMIVRDRWLSRDSF